MANFGMKVTGAAALMESLDEIKDQSTGVANEALVEFAEEVKEEIETTAPVDTGEYRDSWRIEEVRENEVWLVSDAEHGKYIVFPNANFVGHPNADDPGRGIYHNIRGIIKKKRSEFEATVAAKMGDKWF